jgi:hypothetical protein
MEQSVGWWSVAASLWNFVLIEVVVFGETCMVCMLLLYGAKCWMVERSSELVELCINRGGGIWRNLYGLYVAAVWSKVLDFLYGAKWCVFRRIWKEMGEMAVGSRNRTLEAPFASTNCQVSVGTRTRIFKNIK